MNFVPKPKKRKDVRARKTRKRGSFSAGDHVVWTSIALVFMVRLTITENTFLVLF